jgi:hypothetical protein
MPRTETIERTLFKFDELSDDAKEKARQWWRDCENQDSDTSCTFEDAATCAEILGIDLRTRPVKLVGGGTRYEPCIYYSGFYSQGDGACFEGSYSYAKGAAKKIRQHAPKDTELHRIADELQDVQRCNRYKMTATATHRGHYYHSGCMYVDVDCDGASGLCTREDEDTVQRALCDFADWIYRQLRDEYEWRMADEQVDESIRINEYDFTEEGEIA